MKSVNTLFEQIHYLKSYQAVQTIDISSINSAFTSPTSISSFNFFFFFFLGERDLNFHFIIKDIIISINKS